MLRYNGGGISANPARWSKTEGDVPPGGPDVWSTACSDVDWGAGEPPETCPTTALFYPSGTDYTLQAGDVWFWELVTPFPCTISNFFLSGQHVDGSKLLISTSSN
jgi:hypothetical protein